MEVILLTKKEATAIAKEFRRKKIGASFAAKPHDDQVYTTRQTGVKLVHYSYKVTPAQLRFIRARSRRPRGVLVKSSKYGNRRAFPEPREGVVTVHLEKIQERYRDVGNSGVKNYVEQQLLRAKLRGGESLERTTKELQAALGKMRFDKRTKTSLNQAFQAGSVRKFNF